jgi:predicted nucleotidyltransferase
MNSEKSISNIVKFKLKKILPDAKVILFGSRARNEIHKDSDWDFLVLTNKSITNELKNRFFDTLFEAELETDEVITGIIQNLDDWKKYKSSQIFQNIEKEGVEI